jgi:carbon monoxide dehydrogenase subunit G
VQLDHEFTVPVTVDLAWPVLLDVERIGPCMPGATITKVDGKDFEGKVKVKVGPITVTYAGQATFAEIDDDQRRVVIVAKGREARGSGTANATITGQMHDEGEATRVTVHTDLAITGRPAQFGRGVLAEVGGKLIGRFADCLAGQLSGDPAPGTGTEAGGAPGVAADAAAAAPDWAGPTGPVAASGSATASGSVAEAGAAEPVTEAPQPRPVASAASRPQEDDAINLLEAAGGPILKRLAPVAVAILLLVLLLVARRRRAR